MSTVRIFNDELKDFGISSILIVMDRGFYSSDNIKQLSHFYVVTALPSTVAMHDELIMENRDMENSRNYFQYGDETVFLREKRMHGLRYILFFSPRLRTKKIESFYYTLSQKEKNLDVLKGKSFHSSKDMVKSVEEEMNGFNNLVELKYDYKNMKFSYELKHKAIQRKTKRFGYTVLITNTGIAANDLLKYTGRKMLLRNHSHTSNPILNHSSQEQKREQGQECSLRYWDTHS